MDDVNQDGRICVARDSVLGHLLDDLLVYLLNEPIETNKKDGRDFDILPVE